MRNHGRSQDAAVPVPRSIVTLSGLCLLAALTFLLVDSATTEAAPVRGGSIVSTTSTKYGRILVDSRGRTLYLFEKDRSGKSACTGKCATFWPPLITADKPRVAGGAKASLVGTMKRADGRLQVTYNHQPLYTFAKDTKKGQTSGQNVDAFGAEWYVVSAAGAKVEKAASSSGGGGYGS
jgi:predicted lipoprotein with Yx(FWY)xxD motif